MNSKPSSAKNLWVATMAPSDRTAITAKRTYRFCSPNWTRTNNPSVNSRPLCSECALSSPLAFCPYRIRTRLPTTAEVSSLWLGLGSNVAVTVV